MDRFLYIAMSGAKENLYAQSINNHNLANADTHGFRQALADAYTAPVRGPVYPSRDYVQVGNEAIDFTPGPLQSTGRDLDVAVRGEGFIAVQAPDGGEAYTRAGNLHVDNVGILRTERGLPVLGDGGPIAVPPFESILIGTDGTITVRPQGAAPNTLAAVERIRLVNPDTDNLMRTDDGLIRAKDGQPVPPDADVQVVTGMLEGSNVNTVAALTRLMELSRHFEMQVKMMDTADSLEQTSNRLLGIS
ncbi:flagellar basal body rod protein FlgF [Marichromatium bheemlicum]|uniref:Flagellar basal-body rod protein FlgF n=1 Tax=Marichromatium bheemlicum TaxID=365339 RepID=A0ABX1IA03_9GAMM|nr:flagellar basal body rod protein FlgF [Marichromatium bheemlicum]NKN33175.1 flagellar basal body rod protein FlgF [Marichromatium bheemlicum]